MRTRYAIALVALLLMPLCVRADDASFDPEPAPAPLAEREAPYGMVYYYMDADPEVTRKRLESLRDLGCKRPFALIYWWQHETRGNDQYYRDMGYSPEHIGETYLAKLDNFVNIANELGMRPALRLGEMWQGKQWHPGDPEADMNDYADWVHRIASRYRGKVDHYVVIDEMNKGERGIDGRADRYVKEVMIPLSQAIRSADPEAKIGATSVSSAPATWWQLEMVEHGLPQYADGVTTNMPARHTQLRVELLDYMQRMRAVWPEVAFYAAGVGYVEKYPEGQEQRRAATLAQSMFTFFDIGWTSAPYYLYRYSMTQDTRQDFGLVSLPADGSVTDRGPAWYAFQTIAQTFYNRDELEAPEFDIDLQAAQVLGEVGGVTFTLAPPDLVQRAYIRDGQQLLLYLAYPTAPYERDGRFDIVLDTDQWGMPQQIPLLDYQGRDDMPHRYDDGRLVIEDVPVSESPTIITLRKRSE